MRDTRLAIPINRSKAVRTLFLFLLVLAVCHGLVLYIVFVLKRDYAKGFVPLFDMGEEGNIPTYFSSILLFLISYLLFCVWRLEKVAGSRYSRQWSVLPFLAIFLSIDEFATIHEKTIYPLKAAFDLSGPFYYSWVIIGIAGVALIAVLYFRLVFDLPAGFRYGLLYAGLVYLTGALGFEFLGGNYASMYGTGNLPSQLFVTCEEILEMTGLILMINALLKHLEANQIRIEHVFER